MAPGPPSPGRPLPGSRRPPAGRGPRCPLLPEPHSPSGGGAPQSFVLRSAGGARGLSEALAWLPPPPPTVLPGPRGLCLFPTRSSLGVPREPGILLTPTLQNGSYYHLHHPEDRTEGESQGQEGHRAGGSPAGAQTLARSPEPKRAPTRTCGSGPPLPAREASSGQTQRPGSIQGLEMGSPPPSPPPPCLSAGTGLWLRAGYPPPRFPAPRRGPPLPPLSQPPLGGAVTVCKRPLAACSLRPWPRRPRGPRPLARRDGTVACRGACGCPPLSPATRPTPHPPATRGVSLRGRAPGSRAPYL